VGVTNLRAVHFDLAVTDAVAAQGFFGQVL
jgi:hypothetical protein